MGKTRLLQKVRESHRLNEPKDYILPAGLFDSDEGLVFETQIFVDEKPEYYCFANKTNNLTGAEVIELAQA